MPVTDRVAATLHRREQRLMHALAEQFFQQGVACPAHGRHRADLRGRSAMIAVTGRTIRRRQIPPQGQGFPVDTRLVFGQLICRQAITSHETSIGVTPPARCRRPERMRGRLSISDFENPVRAVTVQVATAVSPWESRLP